MKEKFGHIEIKSVSAILLAVFIFAFIHSELGQFTPKGDIHNFHDYCQIVDGATTQLQKTVSTNVFKLQEIKDICFHCVNEVTPSLTSYINLEFEQFNAPHKTTEVYLHNRSFLI